MATREGHEIVQYLKTRGWTEVPTDPEEYGDCNLKRDDGPELTPYAALRVQRADDAMELATLTKSVASSRVEYLSAMETYESLVSDPEARPCEMTAECVAAKKAFHRASYRWTVALLEDIPRMCFLTNLILEELIEVRTKDD